MTNFTPDHIRSYLAHSAETIANLSTQADTIERTANAVLRTLQSGGKILACGNGGSAAEAMHLCEELTGKYCKPRKALPAICLNADPTALTCISNDWDYTCAFSRQVEAFAKPEDALVVFTTSGNSANVLKALQAMRDSSGTTIGLLGRDGGKALPLCDIALVVPGPASHVQEAHQVILHLILEAVDAVYAA